MCPPLVFILGLPCSPPSTAPNAYGVTPAPDGSYPNGNTAEGKDALFSVQVLGNSNTAIGSEALYSDINGDDNTAIGFSTLRSNTDRRYNTATGYTSMELDKEGNSYEYITCTK